MARSITQRLRDELDELELSSDGLRDAIVAILLGLVDELEAEHAGELAVYRSSDAELRAALRSALDQRDRQAEAYRREGDRLDRDVERVEAELADRERDLERLLAVAGAETAEEFEERLAPVDRLHAIAARLEELVNGIDSGRPRPEFLGAPTEPLGTCQQHGDYYSDFCPSCPSQAS